MLPAVIGADVPERAVRAGAWDHRIRNAPRGFAPRPPTGPPTRRRGGGPGTPSGPSGPPTGPREGPGWWWDHQMRGHGGALDTWAPGGAHAHR
ncbi:hypothetical protein FGW37_24745 [Streptomyces rectiverticillatus]|nr:hypothetical protein FGW37_24745 [Streptomyces rectiverticillatus]